ncbi:Cyclin-like F-box [Cordyceps fumosorosea ARSEF 2679]|uniref:Cyclin-like F-box n=1 Tax=Cordyceps fumosorosea (strain ARSEF 2679) TaxID=1081104 RepID=A0A162N0P6_CORFA|nr:Cyclin-like F-box [Cordyceps fumosorosea ARSEF 2679]OAA73649.1 Cyclin-like F-box [Cordyceps fumosorosea ARSEF 2679]
MQQICEHGYDAKDFLLHRCRTPHNDPNVLAVRYHAGAILGSIHRSIAIQQWFQVHYPDPMYPLDTQTRVERSLAAFDLFVLHDQHGDIDEVGFKSDHHGNLHQLTLSPLQTIQLLDTHAAAFMRTQPEWSEMNTRQKALALNQWMRATNLVGLDDQEDFRNLRNCFIGQALRDVKHESIPLISCAIYCGIAERVGLHAECFLPPICAHVVVTAPPGLDLDANPSTDEHQMYLNPFETNGEVPLEYLERLALYANTTISRLRRSGNVAVAAAAKRTARSIEDAHDSAAHFADRLVSGALLRGHPAVNLQLALYAARWALLLLSPPRADNGDTRFMRVMKEIRDNWPEDEWIMAQHLRALQNKGAARGALAANLVLTPPDEHHAANLSDCALTAERVAPFRLGQVFVHRRYQWLGAIVGFYAAPSASSAILDAGSEGAGNHPRKFYIRTITASDLTEQIISSDNLQVVDRFRATEDMFPLAGRYFKRFDRDAGCFVSNVDELYPGLTA